MDDTLHRCGDGTHQHQPAEGRGYNGQQQRNDHAELGRGHGTDDGVGGALGGKTIALDHPVQVLAAIDPGRGQHLGEQALGFGVIFLAIGPQHGIHCFEVIGLKLAELVKAGLIVLLANGRLVAGHVLLEALFKALVQLHVGRGDLAMVAQAHQLLGQHIAVDPGAADHGAVVDPGDAIGSHRLFTGLYGHQSRIGGDHHQRHDGDNHGEARQDPLAQGPVFHSQPSSVLREQEKWAEYSPAAARF
ncbi:hypothetical protein D3C79_713970 [compost metagenome]